MKRIRVVALVVATGLLGGVGAVGCGKGKSAKVATDIALEAAGVIAEGAFMKSPGVDLPDVRPVAQAGDRTKGDARGAFGGTRNRARCDKAQLLAELARDQIKARAWAEARGIVYERLREHIESLTSVVLIRDTLVKNHNYKGDGKITEYLSVLQAGVAVLVDEYGQPAVKCNCGNPLKDPGNIDRKASTYKGERWAGFVEVNVTIVVPRDKDDGPLRKITLADPQQPDKGFERAVGTDGTQDSATVPLPTPSPSAPPSGVPSGAPTGTPSGNPSGSGSRPPTSVPSGTPSAGGSGSSRPPTGVPSTPPRTGTPPRTATPPLPPPSTAKPVTPTRSAQQVPVTPTRLAPPEKTVAPPVRTTAAAPEKTVAPPVRTTAAAPPPKTAAPPVRTTAAAPASPPREKPVAPAPASPPKEKPVAPADPPPARTAAPPARTAAPPAGASAG
ncbi:DUF6777 domain-containing protein [Streptomyces sp. NPDC053048]|uniref:DUF6777 domain-containing protein n=1 Tax=Streptomyces sp. NPDC053048 TaxID=3365694 RepID=UPI0037D25617